MNVRSKVLWLSLVPTVLFVLVIEGGVRATLAVLARSPQPLFQGASELRRFLVEDREEIVRRQGTLHVEPSPPPADSVDLTRGAVIRGRYVTFEKPPGTRRILVFGASAVYGVTGPVETSFPARLEERLGVKVRGVRVEVLNMGVAGIDSERLRAVRQPEGFRFDHDVEIFYYGANDFLAPLVVTSRSELALYRAHNIAYRLSAAYATASGLVLRARGKDLTTETGERLAERYRRNIDAMVQAARARGIQVILATEAFDASYLGTTDGLYQVFVPTYARAMRALKDVAAAHRLEVIDAHAALAEARGPAERRRIFYDPVHLTDEGNAMLGAAVADRLLAVHPEWFQKRK